MPDSLPAPAPTRRRRSDAQRSVEAILGAAGSVLTHRPDASMEEIASAAGVSRQTVYAHFSSREALVAALVTQAASEYERLLDGAALDEVAPDDALGAFLEAGWRFLEGFPLLLNSTAPLPRPAPDPHDTVMPRLERILRRGQDDGIFQTSAPVDWLASAVLALHHAAASQLGAGRLTSDQARSVCLESVRRVCGSPVT